MRWCILLLTITATAVTSQAQTTVPATTAEALNGHQVRLPSDLSPATVLILGFSQKSADNTTAWEKPVRSQLAHGAIGFYDIAMLAQVPGFVRSFVVSRIRKAVPDVLQPNFLTLFNQEDEWKRAAQYDSRSPDAAYVLLVDNRGNVLWRTHDGFSEAAFRQLAAASAARATP